MTNLAKTFETRAEYLEFRADWKAQYKQQTLRIRSLRKQTYELRGEEQSYAQSKLASARKEANRQMQILIDTKAAFKLEREQRTETQAAAA
jgi:hypothetical protein